MHMAAPTPPAPASRKWGAMLGIGLGVFMSTLDGSIVNIALPTLVEALETTFPAVQWVVLSYLLVITAAMLGVARLGDMLGKKRLYVAGMAVFTVGSLLCGLSPSVGALIAARALQGSGAVMMVALGAAIITEIFPPSERGRALGIVGSIVSIGIALGPTIGGILIDLANWHAIFLVNVPVGIVALVVVAKMVPPSQRGRPGQRFDLAGAIVLLVTLACYTLGMTFGQDQGFSGGPLALLAAAAVGFGLFVLVELRVAQPMVDLGMFRNVLFGINLLMAFLVFIVLAGMFLFPFFLQLVQGYSTAQIGLMVAAVPIGMGLISPVSGSLSDRFGSRVISLAGLLLIVAACLLISTLHAEVSVAGYVLRMALLGVGIGVFQSPNNSAIMGAVPRERLGVASGLMALSRTLGQTSGMPLMGALFTVQVMAMTGLPANADITAAPPDALVAGVTGTFRLAAVVILVATALAVFAWRLDRRRQAGAPKARDTIEAVTHPSSSDR